MTDKNNMSEESLRDLFGRNLRRLRKEAHLTQLALAKESNITHAFVNDIENGKKWFSCETMAALCKVLQAEPHQFFSSASTVERENGEILSTYIDDFSDSVLKTIADFKNRYSIDI
jgi:transcriptional regulator with XRE-family HTH domain